MTTTTESAAGRRAGDWTNVLRAELAKLATVQSTYWTLLVAFAANIGFAVLAVALLARFVVVNRRDA